MRSLACPPAPVEWVSIESWPNPTCPECMHGFLVGKENLLQAETGLSQRWRDEDVWEPDWIYGALVGVLTCNDSECGETVAMAGSWRVGDTKSSYAQYEMQLSVRYVDPPLHIIEVPGDTPKPTKLAVEDASRLLLINPSAAANRLRQGIEALMDAKKANKTRYSKTRAGKRRRIRLNPSPTDRLLSSAGRRGG